MNTNVKKPVGKRKAVIYEKECVACGSCVTVCPKIAIHIHKGLFAAVDQNLCIGCGRCKKICPASVIEIEVIPV